MVGGEQERQRRQGEEKREKGGQESPWLKCQCYIGKRAGGREVKGSPWTGVAEGVVRNATQGDCSRYLLRA